MHHAVTDGVSFGVLQAVGFNVLTALLKINTAQLEERIAVYRTAREDQGLDPAAGTVTVMLANTYWDRGSR
jgi:hypothetical protein